MKKTCEIKLNDPNGNGVYYAGQTLSGVVELTLSDIYTVKRIKITIVGEAYCKWVDQKNTATNKPNSSHTNVYIGRETYLNSETYAVQKSSNGVDFDLQAGVHTLNFVCILPPQLPPSIETELGHIRYQIIVKIERPLKPDKKYQMQFNVLIPLNLNNFDVIARHPKYVEKICKFLNFTASSHPLMLRISIPRTGYAIGEVLNITVDADNLSCVDVKYLRFSLLQNILYHSDTPWRNSHLVTKRKVKRKSRMVPKFKHITFDQPITIPYLPVTDDSCRIICVSYDLEIVIVPKGLHNKKKILIPIIIGNVPICSSKYCHYEPLINKTF